MACNRNESHRSYGPQGTGAFLLLAAMLLAGCGIGSEIAGPVAVENDHLKRENAQLAGRLEQCQVDLTQLKAQAQALGALPAGAAREIYGLSSVKISRYSGFYDKDDDGRREKLVVYLVPVDRAGDVVKAPGSASVQLWNLNDPNAPVALGRWQVPQEEMGKLWFSTVASSSYRLMFDVPMTPELLAQVLTVKSTFTDYLSGQVFTDQCAIKPRPTP